MSTPPQDVWKEEGLIAKKKVNFTLRSGFRSYEKNEWEKKILFYEFSLEHQTQNL